MSLIAVKGDQNSHGGGSLNADTQSKVTIGGKLIVCVGSTAESDGLCPLVGGEHCNPVASEGSSKVTIGGRRIHLDGDLRSCGGTTIASGQSKVTIG